MSRYDDDYEEYDDEEDYDDEEEEEDEDESPSRPSSSPFSRPTSSLPGGSRVSGAGLPSSRPATPGGSTPSPIRSGTQGGSSPGGSTPSPIRSGTQGGSSGGSSLFGTGQQRPNTPGGSTQSPFSKPGSSTTPARPGERPAPGGEAKKDDRPKPSGGFSFGSEKRDEPKRDEPKKDDGGKSPLGGLSKGLGGVTSRFGSEKKDEPKKDDGGKSPLGGLGKGLGGVTSRFGGGDDKKTDAKPGSGSGPIGGFMSKLGGDKKDEPRRDQPKKDDGGKSPLGGLFNRGGDKKPEARPSPSSPIASASSSIGSRPPLGGTRPGTPPASAPAAKGAPPKAGGKQSNAGIMDRVRNFKLFPPKQDSKSAKAARGGKPVEVKTLSLSLDKQLELFGIGLVVVSIVLLLTSLSSTQGSLTADINSKLTQFFGWGAIAIPIAMFPVGIWLIMLRAGQDTPVVDLTRVVGAVALYIAVLTLFQFIDSFSYSAGQYPSFQAYLEALRFPLLKISSDLGRGGGMIGGEIYYLLLSNFGELAGFVILVGWLIVSAMLTLSLSAQEIIAIFVSNYRNLRDVQSHRAMRRTAVRAEREAGMAAQIGVSTPAAAQLPGGKSPALPATVSQSAPAASASAAAVPEKPEERSIPITMGGRTVTASFRPGEPATVEANGEAESATAAPVPVRLPPQPEPVLPTPAAEKKSEGSGLFGRLRGAAPVIGAAAAGARLAADAVKDEAAPKRGEEDNRKDESKEKSRLGGLSGGLFRRTESKPADDAPLKPVASAVAPAKQPPAKAPGEAAPEKSRLGGLAGGMFRRGESKPGDEKPVGPAASAASAKPGEAAPEKSRPGGLGSFGKSLGGVTSRFGGGVDQQDKSQDMHAKPAETKPEEAKPAATGTFARPAAPTTGDAPAASSPLSKPAAASAPDKSSEEEPPARLGDLLRRPATPAASTPSEGTPQRPNPFQRPPIGTAAKRDEDDDEEEGQTERLGKTSELRPATSLRPVASASAFPRRPLNDDAEIEDEDIDDDDIEDEDEEEHEDWSKLPPAQPKGVTPPAPAPRPGSPASSPLRPAAAPIPDLQTRMSALRSGQPVGTQPAKTDGEPAETAKRTAASIQDTPKTERPAPRIVRMDDEAKPTDAAEKPAQIPLGRQSASRPVSPAFGKPDPLAAPPSRLSSASPQPSTPSESTPQRPAASQPPSGSGLSAPRPYSPTASDAGYGAAPPPPPPPARTAAPLGSASVAQRVEEAPVPPPPPRRARKEWRLPDLNALLGAGTDQELNHDLLIERARVIEDTLSSFGAPGRVVEVRTGPVITQFGVEPDYVAARGKKNRVKVSAIAALDKDLQLALGAKSIRIEAPVPGKGYVGIEVPNEQAALVRLRDVMESNEFKKIDSPLAIALGQGVDGTPVAADLTSMPHLLIAGTTGSGKSVCVNSIIASLLIRNTPDKVKLVMVDPKRVELTGYNGVPHLISPVVVELERIVSVLKWVTREMEERYRKFSNAAARNIEDFNKHLPAGEQHMPYIIVIIDELADLMMLAPDETERVVTRIAALARATGIHLVIATQRPSVDVVTGLIKANFPARIAFAVAGSVDSRVILDQPGADRLLGRGDMLYMSGDSPAPVRLQGVFVSDAEISNMTRYWRDQLADEDLAAAGRPLLSQFMIDESANRESPMQARSWSPAQANRAAGQAYWDRESTGQSATASFRSSDDDDDMNDGEDAMYEEAVELVRRLNKASVSLLQRRLRIGYTRAARLIDVMEERGVIGPPTEGSKPRDVLPARD